MKLVQSLFAILLLAGLNTYAQTPAGPSIKSTLDSASYGFGQSIGKGLMQDGVKSINYDLMMKGLKDAFTNANPSLSPELAQAAIRNLFDGIQKEKHSGAINGGKTFLETNKGKAGVITTPSGLQYLVIKQGTGEKPAATDKVTVHYKGTLLDGKEFDSSYSRNEPLTLPLNGVIAGWTEGVQLMSVGSTYRFFIPYHLAYGERGAGEDIPPYSTLIFDIELLKVEKQ